jgi:signal transduction histidine kinase
LHRPFTDNTTRLAGEFQKTLEQKEIRLNKEMILLAKRAEQSSYNSLFYSNPDYYSKLMQEDGIGLLIYENDTLKFWSDNSIAVENWIKEVCLDTKIAKLKNGWFEVMKPPANAASSKNIVGLILIKNEYPYQNKYLENEFQKDFSLPAETKLIADNPSVGFPIKNSESEFLFSLEINAKNQSVSALQYIAAIANFLGFVLLVLFLKKLTETSTSRISKNKAAFLFAFLLITLRYFSILFLFPDNFYSFDLFNPKIFADAQSVWLNSLGDLLINALLLLFLVHYLFSTIKLDLPNWFEKRTIKNGFVFLLFLFFFWVSWIINSLFIGLIKHSNIPLSINNLFALNQYSFIAIIIIGLLLLIYFLFANKLVHSINYLKMPLPHLLGVFVLSALIHIFIYHLLGTLDLILIFWPFVLIAIIYVIKKQQSNFPFSTVIFLVFLFSLYAVHILIKHTEIKETENRKIFAERIAAEQDPVAELLFNDIYKKIKTDSILTSYISGHEKQTNEFEKRLKQQYFSGFWDKYDVQITFFDNSCLPIVKSTNSLYDNNFYYDELISKRGTPANAENFYSLENPTGKISYIARINIYKSFKLPQTKLGTLYLELNAKFVSDEIGFPELLLDKNIGLLHETNVYSYAKYKNKQLVNQYGKHKYSITSAPFEKSNEAFQKIIEDGFNHIVYRPDDKTLIVISKHAQRFIDTATAFSFLFTFFSLLLASVVVLQKTATKSLFEGFNFKYRIQVLLVSIVLVSLALFGSGTIYYIKQQFENKNKENISEKTHSVLLDMESKLAAEETLPQSFAEYTGYILKKLSVVFFTDINLYDTNGNLYASSRSKVFDEGLTSKKMNPDAYKQIAVFGKTEFIHDEKIGKLEYLSAYVPFKNNKGKVLAYLNLPYFAKQSELEKEISGFLVALINIYVLLFVLSIITAILISNYVTRPLKLIQDKLSKIKLGKTNETIDWKEKDEIGSLVSEYNRMILELAKSAELLAKSERESAWREMAKQVAHEIKNPLTPMKLSVQHLQRTYKDHAPDMDEKMERLTKTIIEQIDTLSSIATEFSNFAKMPKANIEKVNVNEIVKNAIHLFKTIENVRIHFDSATQENNFVFADKEQLLRVFNNLIKNAIQATEEQENAEIKIIIEQQQQNIIISISDNGCGISPDVIDKIFTPNFTTKTAGMGLGLAMVKSIVESCNGKIWFTTEDKKGTTFFVALPIAN